MRGYKLQVAGQVYLMFAGTKLLSAPFRKLCRALNRNGRWCVLLSWQTFDDTSSNGLIARRAQTMPAALMSNRNVNLES